MGIALSLTIQSHSFHKSKVISSANFLSGGVYEKMNNIEEYFNLKIQNELIWKLELVHLQISTFSNYHIITLSNYSYGGFTNNFRQHAILVCYCDNTGTNDSH